MILNKPSAILTALCCSIIVSSLLGIRVRFCIQKILSRLMAGDYVPRITELYWQLTIVVMKRQMNTFISLFLQPLQYEFMQRGMIAAVLVGIVCAVVGTYVVLRGMAFFGDALAHTILPGIALGYLVSGGARDTLFWWALGTSIVAALGIGTISKNAEIKEDTAIGIIFAGMFALGIALISTVRSYAVDLSHFLFEIGRASCRERV